MQGKFTAQRSIETPSISLTRLVPFFGKIPEKLHPADVAVLLKKWAAAGKLESVEDRVRTAETSKPAHPHP